MKYEYSVNVPTKMKILIFPFESIALQFNAGRQEIRKKKVKMFPGIQARRTKTLEQNCSKSFSWVLLSPWKKVCLKTSEESKKPNVTEASYLPCRENTEKLRKVNENHHKKMLAASWIHHIVLRHIILDSICVNNRKVGSN